MFRFTIALATVLFAGQALGELERYQAPKNISKTCVIRIAKVIQSHPTLKRYMVDKDLITLTWYDVVEDRIICAMTDMHNSRAGTLKVDLGIQMIIDQDCKVGPLLRWEFIESL